MSKITAQKKAGSLEKTQAGNLSYKNMRPPGIEPGSNPWEGSIMPLDHGRHTRVG